MKYNVQWQIENKENGSAFINDFMTSFSFFLSINYCTIGHLSHTKTVQQKKNWNVAFSSLKSLKKQGLNLMGGYLLNSCWFIAAPFVIEPKYNHRCKVI